MTLFPCFSYTCVGTHYFCVLNVGLEVVLPVLVHCCVKSSAKS